MKKGSLLMNKTTYKIKLTCMRNVVHDGENIRLQA